MAHPIDIFVGQNLQKRRLEMGLTLRGLGDKVDIAYQQIQKYERADNRISANVLWRLAKSLDVTVSYFFKGYKEAKALANPKNLPLKDIRSDDALKIIEALNVAVPGLVDQIRATNNQHELVVRN